MKLRKGLISALTLLTLFVPTATFASTNSETLSTNPVTNSQNEIIPMAVGWQKIGTQQAMYVQTRFNSTKSQVWNSGGGSFRIKFDFSGSNRFNVTLYEKDEAGNPSEVIGTQTVTSSGRYLQWDNIKTDGTNGKAELYIILGTGTNNADVIIRAED